MARCCAKPIARIIQVGDSGSGIVGLDELLRTALASAMNDEQAIKTSLLAMARTYGNYIIPEKEEAYKEALYREYLIAQKHSAPKQMKGSR
jgi:hypothetical protein